MENYNVDQPCSARYAFSNVRRNRVGRVAKSFAALSRRRRPRVAAPVAPALFLVAVLIGAVVGGQRAYARDYGLVAMNFDLWCQEEARLPVDRCDQRTLADEKAFEDFQQKLGPYEAQNLRRAQQEQWLDRDFLENDPIDDPLARNPAAATQLPLPRRVDRR